VGEPGTQPRVIRNTDSETLDFVKCFQNDDDIQLAGRRHASNLAAVHDQLGTEASPKPIIPTPLNVELTSNRDEQRPIHIDPSWAVVYVDQNLHDEAKFIASETL